MNKVEATDLVLKVLTPFVRNQEALKQVGPDTRIWEDLQVNSARFIDILLMFEDKLNIEIDDESIEGLATVGEVVQLVMDYSTKNPELVNAAKKELQNGNLSL